MAFFFKRTLFSTKTAILQSLRYCSFPPSDHPDLVSAAVSILKHHRSKSRWTHLRSLSSSGFTPSEVSQIVLQVRNNPRLALRFFLFTVRRSLCSHSLLSYSTIIHVLSRSRFESQAQTLIRSAIAKFHEIHHPNASNLPPIFESLVKTYRTCDSSPLVFDLLIKACIQAKRIDQSVKIVRMLRSKGQFPRISTCNSLIELVSKSNGCSAGFDLYKEIFSGDNAVLPNANTFNTIMIAHHREGSIADVEQVWNEMLSLNCDPNPYSYSILMAAYCENGRMEEAMNVRKKMEAKGLKPDIISYNTSIDGFCRAGEVHKAEEIFREMVFTGIESTASTFEHLINGYCKIEDIDSAMILYKDMCTKGFNPGASTVDFMIKKLCENGRLGEGMKLLGGLMKNHEIIPKRESFERLMKGLCGEGRMDEALKLQGDMVGKGYAPNREIYVEFIEGFMKKGNWEVVERLKREMVEFCE